jgi:anti-sigma regulatory factor (Ser/Thr protein kinase)
VEFYSGDVELVSDVVAHLAASLRSGGTAIAVATEAHRAAFAAGLAEVAGEPDALNRLRILDAEETLQQLLVDGEPDANRFERVIGELIRSSQPPVHIYGEMVTTLWAAARVREAIDLEILWNRLGQSHPFVLLCGYPDESSLWDEHANELERVCELHGAVTGSAVPSQALPEARLEGMNAVERLLSLPRETSSVRMARALVRDVFRDFSPAECETAELLVSELVANALEHGSGQVVTRVVVRDRSVLVSAIDENPLRPVRRKLDATSPRGRGLQIVEALASSWGVTRRTTGGKEVWAELRRAGTSSAER